MKKICLIFALLTLISTLFAYAEAKEETDNWSDASFRLLVHAEKRLNDFSALTLHFIPAGNLIGELSPYLYAGAKFNLGHGFALEPSVGWNFRPGDDAAPIISLMPCYTDDYIFFWGDVEYNHWPIDELYYFGMIDYRLFNKSLMVGLEGEGWGEIDWDKQSIGGGPNMTLSYGQVELNLAIHYRRFPDSPNAFVPVGRLHFSF
ncbi:MAG: hypothetical protein PHD51_02290 [Patescibacteria group bacterium]|nr:hypothetical protein [Patescibacteria group bacterium]MDD5490310.1 hypothetical protein [Patescibacteria group bacterium]